MRRMAVLLAGVILLVIGGVLHLRRNASGTLPLPSRDSKAPATSSADEVTPPAATGRPPDASVPPSLCFSERTYQAILLKHRTKTGGRPMPGPGYITRFQLESQYGFREARLLALAEPDLTERLARATASDPASTLDDVLMACYMLRLIAQQGRAAVKQFLYELAGEDSKERSRLALAALGEADTDGTYRALFWKKCEEGVLEAFDALGNWPDSASIALLGRVRDSTYKKPTPLSTCSRFASEALEKLRILTTSDLSTLGKLLNDPTDNDHTRWAIQAARQLSYPNLVVTLRARLDAGLKAGQESDSWALTNVTDGHLGSIPDHDFDEVLIAYAAMGGKLNAWEQQRLQHFGYACDPRKRLEELLSSGQ